MDRYSGAPFLKLLDCFVLDAIGALDEQQLETLQRMESKLAGVYAQEGKWQDIVAAQLDFPQSMPEQIREIWKRNLLSAQQRGLTLDPREFAIAFVDQNFPREG